MLTLVAYIIGGYEYLWLSMKSRSTNLTNSSDEQDVSRLTVRVSQKKLRSYLQYANGLHDKPDSTRRALHGLDEGDVLRRERVQRGQRRVQDRHRLGQVRVALVLYTLRLGGLAKCNAVSK